jgi:hypothetical protein
MGKNNGKRFTKDERQEFSLDDLAGVPFPSALRKIADARQVAENILHESGLPTGPKTPWTRADGVEMHGFLDRYVSELYPRDSAQWYAAKIVMACHRLENATGNQAIELAYQIGQLTAYARVYQIVDRDSAKGGVKSNRKPWADALAKDLCHLSDDEIYWALADEGDKQVRAGNDRFDILFKEDPITLTHDLIQAIPFDDLDTPKAPQTMRLSTFLKYYVRPARKEAKKV